MQRKASVASFEYEWNTFGFEFAREGWIDDLIVPLVGGAEFFQGKTVIDAGAGSGAQSRWMAEGGARRVISLELSDSIFGRHRQTIGPMEDRIQAIQSDIAHPPLRTKVDVLYCVNVLQHTEDPVATFRALARLLKPDGVFLFNVYTRRSETKFRIVRSVRRLVRFLPFPVWRFLALLITAIAYPLSRIPFLARLTRVVVPISHSFRETWLDVYDAFGGHWFQQNMSLAEQEQMIRESGLTIVRKTQFGFVLTPVRAKPV